ncbi:MAG: helix-turn-helix domain-containing protein [Firmicutes bacterium]|nr:helix-turn-helix domain-containing protein [Bacillota bacterium]
MLSFGERLKRARERKGLTQAQVMKITNISDKSLSRYENGASAPDPDTILELIKLYDVSADYIMGLSYQMGHAADGDGGSSLAAPSLVSGDVDVHEKLDGLSGEARQRAEEYIEMLKTLEEVKSGKNFLDVKKKA